MEVVAVDDGACRVTVREHVEHYVVRSQTLLTVGDGDVGEKALSLVELVEVGSYIHLTTDRYCHWFIDNMKTLEVDLREVSRECCSTGAATADTECGDEGVNAELAFDVAVAAVGFGDEMPTG